MIFLLSGCSNPAVPQGRNEDLSNYTVSDANDVILEGYINAQHHGDKSILMDEFDDFTTIKINDVTVILDETTVSDLASALGLSYDWNDKLNCFALSSGGTVAMLCSTDGSADSPIISLTVCNMLQEFNDLSVEFLTVTDESSPSDVLSSLGQASSSADSDTTSNYQWTWKDDSMDRRALYQMIWYDGKISEIKLSME